MWSDRQISNFFRFLQSRSFSIGLDQYIDATALLRNFVTPSSRSRGNDREIASLLAPLVCGSPEQQDEFYRLFAEWQTGEGEYRRCENPGCARWIKIGPGASRAQRQTCSGRCKTARSRARAKEGAQ